MGYNIANWEMIRTREELVEKLGLDAADDTHTLLNNMVDVRACYKPNGKVRFFCIKCFLSPFMSVYVNACSRNCVKCNCYVFV